MCCNTKKAEGSSRHKGSTKKGNLWWCDTAHGGSGEGGSVPMARGAVPHQGLPLGPTHEEREVVELAVDDETNRE
jgi:hypothetical protein